MKNTNQLDVFEEGRKLRDQGIRTAVDHANVANPKWSDKAFALLLALIATRDSPFMTEDVRAVSKQMLPTPPDARAWGGVMMRARRMGLIELIGYQKSKDPVAHCNPRSVWRKVK